MAYWLMKSEPDVYSIDQLKRDGKTGWSGVRNYQARNFMRAMKTGDRAFFYHSNAEPPGIAGVVEVVREAYPDPTQFDRKSEYFDPRATKEKPVWFHVDVRFLSKFQALLPLDALRGMPALQGMILFRRSRLSVQPVTPEEWDVITKSAAGGS